MKIVKILIADIRKTGGTERAVVNLANDLLENGISVELISVFSDNGTSAYLLNPLIPIIHLNVVFQTTLKKRVLTGFLELYKVLKERYHAAVGDIFVATDPFVSFVMARVHHKNSGNKLIVCEHMALSISKKYSVWFRKFLLKKVDVFVVLTKRDQVFLQNILPKKQSEVIPNRITFNPETLSPCTDKVILSVGRFVRQKNYLELIKMMAPLLKKYSDWKLVVVGSGEQYQELQASIDSYNISKQIILENSTNNIESYFYNSSIYVMSSIYEGFPMVLLEAKAFGLPIVSFDCPNGPAEMIQNDVDGICVPMHDHLNFVKGVERLMQDYTLRINWGKEGNRDVNARFSKDSIIKQWIKLLNSL